MASPQLEKGYTAIANELLEKVYQLKVNGTQFKIIMCVWRFTYGFSRDKHELSETFISKAISVHKKQVSRELNELIKYNIIIVEKVATFTEPRVVSFNKDYDNWHVISREVTKTLPPNELVNATGSELVGSTGSELVTQDKQYLKQQLKQVDTSKPVKHKYGEFKHVLLTDDEKERLITDFGQDIFDKCIVKLDEYIEMKGYKARNHNLCIRKWVINAVGEDNKKEKPKGDGNIAYGENYDTGNCYTLDFYEQFRTAK